MEAQSILLLLKICWIHRIYCYCEDDCLMDISPAQIAASHQGIEAIIGKTTGTPLKHHRANMINSLLHDYDSLMRPQFEENDSYFPGPLSYRALEIFLSDTAGHEGIDATASSQKHHRENVINSLLQNYDSLMRPHFDENVPTAVTVDLYINSVDSISVSSMDFSVNIYLRQSWIDPRLSFANHSDSVFKDIKRLTLDSKLFHKIWVPDLFFPNEKQSHTHCVTMPNRLIRIHPDGRVLYSSRYTLFLACNMDLQKYPFDKQICEIKLESYGYTTNELMFLWREDDPIQMNENLSLPQFRLTRIDWVNFGVSYITGNFTGLRGLFYLSRDYGYFIIQQYIPSVLIVILSWVSFWINMDAVPARISLGVMTVLTITTQCVGIWMSLPRVSYVKAIDVWMSASVAFVFCAMLQFAIVNTLARKEIRRMSIRAREHHKDTSGDLIKRMMDEYTYGSPSRYDPNSRMVARKVDKYSRILFPSAYVVFNVVYWCFYLIET